ncbi:MAG: Na+/H+ antiporter [Actinomycetota bacterium]
MDHVEIIIAALFVSAAGLNVLARWLDVPYPIPLVLGGLLLGLVPGMPDVELDPDLVLLIFLPPLLYSAASFSDLAALRADARAISMSAIGLVLVTIAIVGVIAHEAIGLPWAVSFALGAIVAPTDPAAATAIMRRLGAPRRVVNLVEGESLVNDASALVAYRVAVSAAVGGTFSAFDATIDFVGAVAGGIAIGLVTGWVVAQIRRRVDDPTTGTAISLLTGYAAFLPAEELHVSGVLAAVTAGLYMGWYAPSIVSPEGRLQSGATWDVLTFLLNAALFILIGLQLPVIVDGLDAYSLSEAIAYAALICATVVGTRFLWLFTMPYVLRTVDRRPQQRERRIGAAPRIVIGWAGMRGAVSLAAALALPLETDAGAALPGRDLILFITFALILFTVVVQGLTLPVLLRRLGVRMEESEVEREEAKARYVAAQAGIARIEELRTVEWTNEDTIDRMRGLREFRIRRLKVRMGKMEDEDGVEERSLAYQRLLHEIYAAERAALIQLRNDGGIGTDAINRVMRELDLEESRLEI